MQVCHEAGTRGLAIRACWGGSALFSANRTINTIHQSNRTGVLITNMMHMRKDLTVRMVRINREASGIYGARRRPLDQ